MATYTENMDAILAVFKTAWDATGVPVVYETTEADLKPHPRNSGAPWVRLVVRHNDATQASLSKVLWRRYGFVWIQVFVPATFASAWDTAQSLAEVAQRAYEQPAPGITYLRTGIVDKPKSGDWIRKDVRVFFHWEEVRSSIIAALPPGLFGGGYDTSLGIASAASIYLECNLTASAALGISQAAALYLETHLSAAQSLGVSESVLLEIERDLAAAPSLGFDVLPIITLEVDISANMAVGIGMIARSSNIAEIYEPEYDPLFWFDPTAEPVGWFDNDISSNVS